MTTARPADPHRGAALAGAVAAASVLAMVGALGAVVARETGGRFAYALDDPYIHLALAEEMARGHYGVNPGQFASPSSSILWPALLAPFARYDFGLLWPFIVNAVAGAAAAAIAARVAWDAIGAGPRRTVAASIVGAAAAFIANVPALVFIGMEHTLHVALAALAVLGMVRESREGRVEWWLLAALVVGPLIRYEHLALTVPALVYLWRRGHRRPAIVAGVATAAALAAFSLFLVTLGLPALPTSVLAKVPAARYGGVLGPIAGFAANMIHERGRLLLVAAAGFSLVALVNSGMPRPNRALAAWAASALGLHLLFGDVGWLARYEAYAVALALLLAIALFGDALGTLVRERVPLRAGILAVALTIALGMEPVQAMLRVPGGARDVLNQSCEVRRFVVDYWRGPIAVNDLGCVSWRNDGEVLDLWGLASERALRARRAGGLAWMDAIADDAGVGFVAIHPEMFARQIPGNWIPLGDLDLGTPVSVVAAARVSFFARDEVTAARARTLLGEWSAGLPAPARFEPAR